jgi:hypothetical protein
MGGQLSLILWRDKMDVPSQCTIVRTGRDSVQAQAAEGWGGRSGMESKTHNKRA